MHAFLWCENFAPELSLVGERQNYCTSARHARFDTHEIQLTNREVCMPHHNAQRDPRAFDKCCSNSCNSSGSSECWLVKLRYPQLHSAPSIGYGGISDLNSHFNTLEVPPLGKNQQQGKHVVQQEFEEVVVFSAFTLPTEVVSSLVLHLDKNVVFVVCERTFIGKRL